MTQQKPQKPSPERVKLECLKIAFKIEKWSKSSTSVLEKAKVLHAWIVEREK